jgi:hypothetical protein
MLEGNLEDFTLPDILRLLASTSKSGRLAIQREGAAGRVDLADGQVREASGDADHLAIARRLLGAGLATADDLTEVLRGRDGLPTDLEVARDLAGSGRVEAGTLAEVVREQTVDAVFDLLRWKQGRFRFDGHTPASSDGQVLDLAVPVDEVLAEATARLESWPSVEERTGAGDAVVTISRPAGERTEVSLTPDGWSLLSYVDGRRTVAELAHLSGQGEFRTRRTLAALLDEGVVTVAEAGGPGQVERLLADHDRIVALEAELSGVPVSPRPASAVTPPVPAPAASPAVLASAGAAASADAVHERPRPTRASLRENGRPGPVTVRPEEVAAAVDDGSAGTPDPARPGSERPGPERPGHEGPGHPHGARLRTDPTVDGELVRRLIDGVERL